MIKHWTKLLLPTMVAFILLSVCLVTQVSASVDEDAAYLHELGLFKGTSNGFELEREATRVEALVMLLRLLGKEQEALRSTDLHPFDDVPAWADRYVAYAYAQGITSGISRTSFGSDQPINDQQYFTFVLRALRYDDRQGDFVWNSARQKAIELGIVDSEWQTEGNLTRGHFASISRMALSAELKGSTQMLLELLVSIGAVEASAPLSSNGAIEVYENRVVMSIAESNEVYQLIPDLVHQAFPNAVYRRGAVVSNTPRHLAQSVIGDTFFFPDPLTIEESPLLADKQSRNRETIDWLLDADRSVIAYAFSSDIDYEAMTITWRTEFPEEYIKWMERYENSVASVIQIPASAYQLTSEICYPDGRCLQYMNPSLTDYSMLNKAAYVYDLGRPSSFEELSTEGRIGLAYYVVIADDPENNPGMNNIYEPDKGIILGDTSVVPYRMTLYLDDQYRIIAYTLWDFAE